MTFFGAPLNNYMSHAACAMVRRLRSGKGELGLLSALGGGLSKHHGVVLSTKAPTQPLVEDYSVQAVADTKRGVIPEILDAYTGPADIERIAVRCLSNRCLTKRVAQDFDVTLPHHGSKMVPQLLIEFFS